MSNVINFPNKDCIQVVACPKCNCIEFIITKELQVICAECMHGYEKAMVAQREQGENSNDSIH